MHETIIAGKIIEEAEKLGVKKQIEIECGELGDLSKEELKEALKEMSDFKIKVTGKVSMIKCSCGYEGRAKIVDRGHGYCLYNCPECENKKPEVIEGGEIKIIGVE